MKSAEQREFEILDELIAISDGLSRVRDLTPQERALQKSLHRYLSRYLSRRLGA